ncbi:hypothetical protein GCM10023086_70670 [Streptomyces venetus]|uniref:Integrase n=1 Tax=Streptomyces venetus TaxID=1701086 RepID=A0ABP8HBK1_9ACTN
MPRFVLERRKSPYPTTADQLYEKDLRTGPRRCSLHRNGLETALYLDRWMRECDIAPE